MLYQNLNSSNLTLFQMNKKLLLKIFSSVLLLVSLINLNILGFQNAVALTEPNDETDIPASCSDKFIKMMDVFEAEFYNEMDKIVHSGKLESQVSTEYMDAYQNTRRRFNELTNKVIADLIGVDLVQGTNLVESCLGIKQAYLQRVEFGFK